MKKLILVVALLVIVSACKKKEQLETTTIRVNSIVCGTCAKNIQKAIYTVEGVKAVDVDVKKKVATISFLPAITNLETIEVTITDAGYDANDRKRDAAAYDQLDGCCKIDG